MRSCIDVGTSTGSLCSGFGELRWLQEEDSRDEQCLENNSPNEEMVTPEYKRWWSKKVNDNVPGPNQEYVRSMEEYLQMVPSKIEIIKHDFEKRNL
ncbi:hypothetical protein Gotur_028823, partial [Gossypium turneri]